MHTNEEHPGGTRLLLGPAKELVLQQSIAASDMYKLLSMFFRFPTEEMAIGILDGSLSDDVLAIFEELGIWDNRTELIKTKLGTLQVGLSEKDAYITQMRREYTRLFSHPSEPVINLYETLFLFEPEEKGQDKPVLFISPAALDAERCYRKAGFVRSNTVNEPSDHLSIEFEFMAYLYLNKARALHENNGDQPAQLNIQIREFSEIHLRKWALNFFDRCVSSSTSPIYETFGRIGNIFLHQILSN
jgi:TorA maturation chaperone TorD